MPTRFLRRLHLPLCVICKHLRLTNSGVRSQDVPRNREKRGYRYTMLDGRV